MSSRFGWLTVDGLMLSLRAAGLGLLTVPRGDLAGGAECAAGITAGGLRPNSLDKSLNMSSPFL
jgi:hypothetical protein